MYHELFRIMVDRGLMVETYETAQDLVDAYLRADWTVRDRAMYPHRHSDDLERLRASLLDRLAL
jgi:hypothetical protein